MNPNLVSRQDQERHVERDGGDAPEERDRRGRRGADLHQGPVRGHRLHRASIPQVEKNSCNK